MLSNEYRMIDSHHFLTEVATQPTSADRAILDHFYTGLGLASIALPLVLAIGLHYWEKYQQQRQIRHQHQSDRSWLTDKTRREEQNPVI